jgi:hypothetical protein
MSMSILISSFCSFFSVLGSVAFVRSFDFGFFLEAKRYWVLYTSISFGLGVSALIILIFFWFSNESLNFFLDYFQVVQFTSVVFLVNLVLGGIRFVMPIPTKT